MAEVVFIKGDNDTITNIPVDDGQILFDEEKKEILVDGENGRVNYSDLKLDKQGGTVGTLTVDGDLTVESGNDINVENGNIDVNGKISCVVSETTDLNATHSITTDGIKGNFGIFRTILGEQFTPYTRALDIDASVTNFTGNIQSNIVQCSNVLCTKINDNTIPTNYNFVKVKGEAELTYRDGNVNITKANLGIGNVENKSSEMIRNELTYSNVTNALGFAPTNPNVVGLQLETSPQITQPIEVEAGTSIMQLSLSEGCWLITGYCNGTPITIGTRHGINPFQSLWVNEGYTIECKVDSKVIIHPDPTYFYLTAVRLRV